MGQEYLTGGTTPEEAIYGAGRGNKEAGTSWATPPEGSGGREKWGITEEEWTKTAEQWGE